MLACVIRVPSMWVKDWNEVVGTAELTPNAPAAMVIWNTWIQ